jgi:hypothetical protein
MFTRRAIHTHHKGLTTMRRLLFLPIFALLTVASVGAVHAQQTISVNPNPAPAYSTVIVSGCGYTSHRNHMALGFWQVGSGTNYYEDINPDPTGCFSTQLAVESPGNYVAAVYLETNNSQLSRVEFSVQ